MCLLCFLVVLYIILTHVYHIGLKLILEFNKIQLKEKRKANVAKPEYYTDCRPNYYGFQN